MTPDQRAVWDRFCAETGHEGEPFEVDHFGDDAAMADELAELILAGRKQATCALARWYELPGDRYPRAGDLSLVLDGRGTARCVVRTESVEIKPVREADAQFAWDEGEGDRSFEYWWREHLAYWQREAATHGFAFSTEMDACFERFKLVWVAD